MPAHKTLKEYQRARDTALYPYWYFHLCHECSWFDCESLCRREPAPKNFCSKWDRKVNPDQYARSCFVFRRPKGTRPILLGCARDEGVDRRPFTWKKGVCKWHQEEFYYKEYHPNDIRRYCSDYCRWKFKRFVRKIKKNSQLMRPNSQVSSTEREGSRRDGYFFSVSWGAQSATGTRSSVRIKIPIWISYYIANRYFARWCSIFVIFYFIG
jgi:hypothetical protein